MSKLSNYPKATIKEQIRLWKKKVKEYESERTWIDQKIVRDTKQMMKWQQALIEKEGGHK